MKCMNKCGKEAKANSKYCSNSCRAVYSRNARNTGAAQQAETGAAPERATTLTDAAGNVHEIDYEGRRADVKVLESWANGKGTLNQQNMGKLALHYSMMNGFRDNTGKLTVQGRRYLGRTA